MPAGALSGSADDFRKAQEKDFRAYAEHLTVRSLEFSEHDKLLFLDEVGNPRPSASHSALHFCGIAVPGAGYMHLKGEWSTIRKEVFGLGRRDDFSSAKHIRRLFLSGDTKRLSQLYTFIDTAPFHRVISWHPHQGMLIGRGANEKMAVGTTISVIADQAELIFGNAQQIWIIEHSTVLPWTLVQNMMTGHPWCMPPRNAKICFMRKKDVWEPGLQKKKTIEPGLDLADMCAFLWSQHVSSGALEGMKGPGSEYGPLYQLVFRKFPQPPSFGEQ